MSDILIVDDREDVAVSAKWAVISAVDGVDVDISTHPLDALEMVKKRKYDLIIVNYLMPDMRGDEFIRSVREIYPEQRFILLTGYPIKDMKSLLAGISPISVLEKPWNVEDLRELIRTSVSTAGGGETTAEAAIKTAEKTSRKLRIDGEEEPVEFIFEFPSPEELNRFVMLAKSRNFIRIKETTSFEDKYVAKVLVYPRYDISFLRDEA